ncbi:MAG: hypothetical protein ACRDBX_05715 [Erysipelotrichaceae bacterium]
MFDNLKRLRQRYKAKDEALSHKFDDVEFEKDDPLALFIAAFITFVPVIVLILGAFFFILWFFFAR